MSRTIQTHFVLAEFGRPEIGLTFTPEQCDLECAFSGELGWQSNGGPHRGHPARSLPFSMEAKIDPDNGPLLRLHVLGVFALHAARDEESLGTLGASIQLNNSRDTVFRQDLLNGRHYKDARDLTPLDQVNGDGTSLKTVGFSMVGGSPVRVDLINIDVPPDVTVESIRFKDLGSPASFIVFDFVLEHALAKGCPFHVHSGGISLGEIGSSIRIGDRVKFSKALEQMEAAVLATEDLDEARGEAAPEKCIGHCWRARANWKRLVRSRASPRLSGDAPRTSLLRYSKRFRGRHRISSIEPSRWWRGTTPRTSRTRV